MGVAMRYRCVWQVMDQLCDDGTKCRMACFDETCKDQLAEWIGSMNFDSVMCPRLHRLSDEHCMSYEAQPYRHVWAPVRRGGVGLCAGGCASGWSRCGWICGWVARTVARLHVTFFPVLSDDSVVTGVILAANLVGYSPRTNVARTLCRALKRARTV
jgi:hypothetical protein